MSTERDTPPRVSDETIARVVRDEDDPSTGIGAIIPNLAMDLRDSRAEVAGLKHEIEDLRGSRGEWQTHATNNAAIALRAAEERDAALRERDEWMSRAENAAFPRSPLNEAEKAIARARDDSRAEVAALRAELAAERAAVMKEMVPLANAAIRYARGDFESVATWAVEEMAALRARLEAAERAARAIKIAVAPDFCGGTDFWDAHTPDEIRDEGVRRFNATVDAITDTQRRVNEELRAALDERTRAVATYEKTLHRIADNRCSEDEPCFQLARNVLAATAAPPAAMPPEVAP